jgi:hypothetical protein
LKSYGFYATFHYRDGDVNRLCPRRQPSRKGEKTQTGRSRRVACQRHRLTAAATEIDALPVSAAARRSCIQLLQPRYALKAAVAPKFPQVGRSMAWLNSTPTMVSAAWQYLPDGKARRGEPRKGLF